MKIIAFILTLLCISLDSFTQVAPQKYFILFTDKNNSPFSTDRPHEFLTDRSIERRARQGIEVVENDLPVNENYIAAVKSVGGNVLTASKWLNGITIYTSDTMVINQIELLPFVAGVVKSVQNKEPGMNALSDKFETEQATIKPVTPQLLITHSASPESYNYGISYNQIHMVNGDQLHNLGYRGEGMVIAILDGGFFMANTLPAFDSLRINNQILGTKDFVVPGNNVYIEHPHGMEVLSIIGGNLPGQLVGTAPKAKFWLLRSEDTNSEYLVEEYNWVSAAEFADSVGADVINSSLGYTTFDDTTMNHTCTDMSGDVTPVSKGANIAASKGLIVVNSAGNSGGSSWKCVGAPADAYMALAIAAVDSMGKHAQFSSTGTINNRVKPNLAAQGRATVLSAPDGSVSRGNGTSFSSPVIAGMMACLWQAVRSLDYKTVIRAVEISASKSLNPDSLLGYGIPDFAAALTRAGVEPDIQEVNVNVFPNPFTDHLTIVMPVAPARQVEVILYDLMGKTVYKQTCLKEGTGNNTINLALPDNLKHSCYSLKLISDEFTIVTMICK